MASIDGTLLDFRRLDLLAIGSSPVHRLDARAKVLATLFFIITVVSFGRYEIAPLFPFFLFPVSMGAIGGLPFGYIARKILLVFPIVVLVVIFNPMFDREVLVHLGPVGISGGWISFASVILRAVLTVGGAVILLAITGFPAICHALERLGLPRIFAMQLHFLYRYIFVLAEEGARGARARELRTFGRKGMGIAPFGSLVGNLLLRTWLRGERIHMAMLARGFNGEFHVRNRTSFGLKEFLFLSGWTLLFIFFRIGNPTELLGRLVTGVLP